MMPGVRSRLRRARPRQHAAEITADRARAQHRDPRMTPWLLSQCNPRETTDRL